MSRPRRTGVLGGTFDPIHLGHLALAHEAWQALDLDDVLLLPLRVPAHRPSQPEASPYHRFAMAGIAALGARGPLRASDIDLARPGTTYTADTLRSLHAAGWQAGELFFLIGADACADLATWREYPSLLDLAHFVVCARPGWSLDAARDRDPEIARRIAACPPGAGAPPSIVLLDRATPDVSSTIVRARARAGLPIADLVPPEVDHYIRRHRLYGSALPDRASGRSAAGNLHE